MTSQVCNILLGFEICFSSHSPAPLNAKRKRPALPEDIENYEDTCDYEETAEQSFETHEKDLLTDSFNELANE